MVREVLASVTMLRSKGARGFLEQSLLASVAVLAGAGACSAPPAADVDVAVGETQVVSEAVVSGVNDPPFVADGTYVRPYQIYGYDGTVLQASSSGGLSMVPASSSSSSTTFIFLPVQTSQANVLMPNDIFLMYDSFGNYLNHQF